MDEDLDRVKDQLEELESTLDKMKDGETATPDRIDDQAGTGRPEPASTDHISSDTVDTPQDTGTETGVDQDGPSGTDGTQTTKKASETSGDDDPHPSPLERFRDKLDHGHEAADKEHFQEAQTIYRSLIQEYRGLKSRDKLTDEDKERLHTLYEKVDRAKE
jgi:TolA-binding protein